MYWFVNDSQTARDWDDLDRDFALFVFNLVSRSVAMIDSIQKTVSSIFAWVMGTQFWDSAV